MDTTDFIKAHELEFDTLRVDENPNLAEPWDAYHYEVTIYGKSKQFTIYYSMGKGCSGSPSLVEVLDCLKLDAQSVSQPFEDWAADMGYSSDSIKALKTFKACKRNTSRLKLFLGTTAYAELLQCDEAGVTQ